MILSAKVLFFLYIQKCFQFYFPIKILIVLKICLVGYKLSKDVLNSLAGKFESLYCYGLLMVKFSSPCLKYYLVILNLTAGKKIEVALELFCTE